MYKFTSCEISTLRACGFATNEKGLFATKKTKNDLYLQTRHNGQWRVFKDDKLIAEGIATSAITGALAATNVALDMMS